MKTFIFEGINNDCDNYLDLYFTDTCKNAIRRLWSVTYDKSEKSWSGLLLRSKTDDGEFNHSVPLPKKLLVKILKENQSVKTFEVIDLETGQKHKWPTDKIVSEINRDRSDGWSDYDLSDFAKGWNEWIEGDYYSCPEIANYKTQ